MSTIAASPQMPIRVDEQGCAWIEGTRYKVLTIVLDHLAFGWRPEEVFLQHNREVPLAKIYAALAYYYANQAALDEAIKEALENNRYKLAWS